VIELNSSGKREDTSLYYWLNMKRH